MSTRHHAKKQCVVAWCLPYMILYAIAMYHMYRAPYTKVEESFQVQAVHDILYLGVRPATLGGTEYDHMEFPGVVPRTFVGALVISVLSLPFKFLLVACGLASQKIVLLMVARGVLAALVCVGLWFFGKQFNAPCVGYIFGLVCSLQFHLPFYMSRMLPNTCALVLTSAGFGYWMKVLNAEQCKAKDVRATIVILTCAAIVFRCDAIILVGLIGIHMVVTKRVTLIDGLWIGALACGASLVLTVLIDSYFWRRWLWPEGEVLYFNTVLNKSKEWGVSPMHWYFTSALPRMLHIAYPMAFVGALVDSRARSMMIIALGFVLLYSKLEHKEVRFLFPTIPLWNMSAALGIHTLIFISKRRSVVTKGLVLCCIIGLLLGSAMTLASSAASYANYPGGTGLVEAIRIAQGTGNATIHIDTLAATTGVSRFLQEEKDLLQQKQGDDGTRIRYSKEEGIQLEEYQHRSFTHLVNEHRHVPGYTLVKEIQGFDRIDITSVFKKCITREHLMGTMPRGIVSICKCLASSEIPFFTVRLKNVVFIHRNVAH